VSELTFSGGTSLRLERGDVVVIVGPNNSGKSEMLRAIRGKVASDKAESPVLTSVALGRTGTDDDLTAWLESTTHRDHGGDPARPRFLAYGADVELPTAHHLWAHPQGGLQRLARFFCHLLTTEERLLASRPAPAFSLRDEAPSNPVHHLYRDDRLEMAISDKCKKAFGADLIVNRCAGKSIPLHIGRRPETEVGEDRVSSGYVERLIKLPTLAEQGDGMRSFVGILLHTLFGKESILLVDEPEAFLHPPQARLLGQMLIAENPPDRQMFIATHSVDVLRGVLDGNTGKVRVVRVCRDGSCNAAHELAPPDVRKLWVDPLLRASNILDGVFHELVIVSESDGDSRFFAAMVDSLHESGMLGTPRKPDVMFTHCGGKDRLHVVMKALRALDVPVRAVADIDILSTEQPLAKLVAATGHDWSSLEADWNLVNRAINSIKPQLRTADVKEAVQSILATISTTDFPREARSRIEDVLKQTSPWALAKKIGKTFVPSGDPTRAYDRLADQLRHVGVFLVEVGELERFCPSVGGHGPTWVNEVLSRNLATDPSLEEARVFVKRLLG
jgi:energy-coupling factor transporter ATP-binding protein EcfA2